MPYRVNVDRPTISARIHRGDCRYIGRRPKKPEHGGRRGPYATLEEAKQAAKDTGLQVSKCRKCNP